MQPHNPPNKDLTPKKDVVTGTAGEITKLKAERIEQTSPETFSVYSNDIQVHTSPWDMKFRFGEIVGPVSGSSEEPILKVNILGEVRLSLQIAKRLASIMIAQIQAYEATIGEIPQPKE